MDKTKIESYLTTHEYISLGITKDELLQDGGARYFNLLEEVIHKDEYLKKFCGKLFMGFKGYTEEEMWQAKEIHSFVQKLNEIVPCLFYLAEKENQTLKLLMIFQCFSGETSGEDMGLDKTKFDSYLKSQLKEIILCSQKVGFSPDHAQSIINDVYSYFGI